MLAAKSQHMRTHTHTKAYTYIADIEMNTRDLC